MKWNEHRGCLDMLCAAQGIDKQKLIDEPGAAYSAFIHLMNPKTLKSMGEYAGATANFITTAISEIGWIRNKRPYYNLWPSVLEAFTKIDLSKIPCSDVKLPRNELVVRLPQTSEKLPFRAFFVSSAARFSTDPTKIGFHKDGDVRDEKGIVIAVDTGETGHWKKYKSIFSKDGDYDLVPHPIHTVSAISLARDTIGDAVNESFGNFLPSEDNPELERVNEQATRTAFQILVTICLLNNNPDLIQPSPIESDREKWEQTHDLKYIEKAVRRGKQEWDIGRQIEVAPGFRRPHFAVRWMGHGLPKRPVIRPVKGCLVRRDKVVAVPTGYMDESDTPE